MSGLEGRILTLVKNLEEEKRLADKRAKQLYLEGASFIGHGDTPAAYAGQAGKFIKVNAVPDALVFVDHNKALHNALALTELGTVSAGVWQGTPVGNAYVAGINQNLLTTSSPIHVTVKLSALTDGYVPKHTSDAVGLANSPIFILGANVGIGETTPVSKLDLGTNYGDPGIYPNKIVLWHNGENDYIGMGVSSQDFDLFALANFRFYTGYDGTPGSEKFTILKSGYVGILKQPTCALDVAGVVKATSISLSTYPKLDDMAVPDDNTDLNATTGRHGLLKKLGGGTTNFLRADGAWATPTPGAHAASHHSGGGDPLAFASIAGFSTYLDQAVKQASNPTFANLYVTTKLTIGSATPMAGAAFQARANADNAYAASIENDYAGGWGLYIDIDGSDALDPIFKCNSGSTVRFTVKADGDVEWYCGETGSTANAYHGPGVNSVTLRKVSAQRYKDKITDFELDSSVIYNFRPISYKSLCKADAGKGRFHGFIAEEMEQYCPEMIEYDENNKTLGFDSGVLQALMLAEIQRHEAKIKALQAQLNN